MPKPLLASLALALFCTAASAQTYPVRPVNMVVAFPVGVSADLIARGLAESLTQSLGQPVVVQNQPGAGGNIAAGAVARAQPDGYTIMLATTAQAATNKFMYKNLPFDSERDLEPIVIVGTSPIVVVARPALPVRNMKELVEYARANPDKLSVGSPGNGTLGHITGELIAQRQGVKLTAVQYPGSVAIQTNLMGGHIDLGMDSIAPYVQMVQSGKLRALAIGAKQRFAGLPDVPTMAEAGFPALEASVFYAMLAPKGIPPEIVTRLNAATNDYLKTPSARTTLGNFAVQIAGSTPAEAKAYIADEMAKWGPIIRAANIQF